MKDYEIKELYEKLDKDERLCKKAIVSFRNTLLDRSVMGIDSDYVYTNTSGGVRAYRGNSKIEINRDILFEVLIVLDYFKKNQPYAGYIHKWDHNALKAFIMRHIFCEDGEPTIDYRKAADIASFILEISNKYTEVFRLNLTTKPDIDKFRRIVNE